MRNEHSICAWLENLEAKGFQVFLPQRDGVESEKPLNSEMANDELQQTIFELDRERFLQADIRARWSGT
jgi:hypothetical protein